MCVRHWCFFFFESTRIYIYLSTYRYGTPVRKRGSDFFLPQSFYLNLSPNLSYMKTPHVSHTDRKKNLLRSHFHFPPVILPELLNSTLYQSYTAAVSTLLAISMIFLFSHNPIIMLHNRLTIFVLYCLHVDHSNLLLVQSTTSTNTSVFEHFRNHCPTAYISMYDIILRKPRFEN